MSVLKRALRGSKVVDLLSGPAPDDREGTVDDATEGRNWTDGSVLVGAARRVRGGLSTAFAASRTRRVALAPAVWTRHSWLYRWLTAPPDRDVVVVVDLRETRTVGPVLWILDRVVAALSEGVANSTVANLARATADRVSTAPVRAAGLVAVVATATGTLARAATGGLTRTGLFVATAVLALGALGTQVRASAGELADSWVGRLAMEVLEPPEPPGDESDPGGEADGTDSEPPQTDPGEASDDGG